MRIATYVLILGVGVLVGMAACGANNEQPLPATQPVAEPGVVPPVAQAPPETLEKPVQAAVEKVQQEAVERPTQTQTTPPPAQTAQQATQQQAITPPKPTEQKEPEPKPAFETEKAKLSYTLGVSVGNSLKQQGFDVDLDIFKQGVADILADKELALTNEEMSKVMIATQEHQMKERQERMQKTLEEGEAFLEENKKKPGVVTLPSGLQYKIIRPGTGAVPVATDKVRTHYRGTLINGEEFDSSFTRGAPAEFGVMQIIPGWQEALQIMKVGAKWELYIPAALGYGEREPSPKIPANSALIFELELLDILK